MSPINVMSSRVLRLRWLVIMAALIAALLSPIAADGVTAPVAPTGVKATSLGEDTVQVDWTAVPGAARYVVKYSKSSKFTKPVTYKVPSSYLKTPPAPVAPPVAHAYIKKLTRNTTYYFRVYVYVGTNTTPSSGSKTVSAKPKYEYGAVAGIKTSNIGGKFVEVNWVFNEVTLGTPGWRIRAVPVNGSGSSPYNNVGSDPVGKVTGLTPNKSYYISVASLLPADAPADGDTPAVRIGPYSKAIKVKTSNYRVDPPAELTMVKAAQKSTSIEVNWKAPAGFKTGDQYVVQYSRHSSMSGSKTTKTTALSKTVTGLTPNINYFMRVYVVNSNGTRVSDSSDAIQTKTPTLRGYFRGHVTLPAGATSSDYDNLVVTAYADKSSMSDSGNLVDKSDVDASGYYHFAVRPGTYRVQVSYVGEKNYTSAWVKSTIPSGVSSWMGDIASTSDDASKWSIKSTYTTASPRTISPVTLGVGGTVTGKVMDNKKKPLKSVDVTVRSCMSQGTTYRRDVTAETMTDTSGNYRVTGLADGAYWMRYVYNNGDGFTAGATAIKIKNHGVVKALPAGGSCLKFGADVPLSDVNMYMALSPFQTTYAIHVYGPRKVGTRLTTKINRWIGSQYGSSATHSAVSWVWTRDGKNISGTTGSDKGTGSHDHCTHTRCTPTYKLTSKDRGHYVSLKVTYSGYGYITTTKSYKKFKVR